MLVRNGGRNVYTLTEGVRDFVRKRYRCPHEFPPGSFTKQFTAMAIMLLVHDGRLRYDQSLAELFPIPPTANDHRSKLLNHTSGLPIRRFDGAAEK